MADNNKVVIIGANGTMGAGAGCVFAGAGYNVTMLARSAGKAAEGLADAQNDARAEAIAERISLGAYDADLGLRHNPTKLLLDPSIDWTAFSVWLSALLHARGDDVLRVKGIARTPAGRMLLPAATSSSTSTQGLCGPS